MDDEAGGNEVMRLVSDLDIEGFFRPEGSDRLNGIEVNLQEDVVHRSVIGVATVVLRFREDLKVGRIVVEWVPILMVDMSFIGIKERERVRLPRAQAIDERCQRKIVGRCFSSEAVLAD